jgi:quinolinate synthase
MNRAFTMPSIVVRRMASYMTGMKRILSVLLLVALVAGLSLIWVQRKADPAMRRHPRALLPEAGNPGPCRFRRRFARTVAQGAATDAEVIAFCGVKFMADTAKILSPEKIVVLPDLDAGCSLEDSCPPEKFKAFREAHPDHIALTYINCSTEVKALSDIIVTSSSAETILARSRPTRRSSSAPTGIWAAICARKFGRDMLLWPGVCIVHEAFSAKPNCSSSRPSTPARRSPRTPNARRTSSTMPIMSARPAASSICQDLPRRHADRRDRTAHHPPDGTGDAGQDLHRRARRGRQLRLQHLPLHGAQHAGKALPRAARPQPRIEIEEGLRLKAKKSLDRMLEMASGTVGKGDLGALTKTHSASIKSTFRQNDMPMEIL